MPKNTILYLGLSLDGKLADENGGVDWLTEYGQGDENEFSRLLEEIDTVVMGRTTYDQIKEELSPDKWLYEGLKCYVVTSRPFPCTEEAEPVVGDFCALIDKLRHEEGKGIWICGGAKLTAELLNHDLIDEYRITLLPVILGKGISLFERAERRIPLQLMEESQCGGWVSLRYHSKREERM